MKVHQRWWVYIGRTPEGELCLWIYSRAHNPVTWSLRWWERGAYALLLALGLFELSSWAWDLSSLFELWIQILQLGSMA